MSKGENSISESEQVVFPSFGQYHGEPYKEDQGQSHVGKLPVELGRYTWCLVLMDAHYDLATPPGSHKEKTKFNNPVSWEGTRAGSGG